MDGRLKIKAQVVADGDYAIGPGKAALLDAIANTGSISAAGRAMGMSYRRAWLLVDAMNRHWRAPLVATAHGGHRGGGAGLTDLGSAVLANYRALETALAAAAVLPATRLLADLAGPPAE